MLRRSIFVLCLVFGVEYVTSNALGNKNVCSTQGCRESAELLSKNIDRSVDPCDDFYNFACGGYIKSSTIPDGEHRIGRYFNLQKEIHSQIRGLLAEKVDPKEPRIFGQAKNYYKSCLDESTGPKNLVILKSIIKQLGGWPVVEGSEWKEEDFDIFDADRTLRGIGYKPNRIFKIYSSLDLSNTSRSSLFIGPPNTIANLESLKYSIFSSETNKAYYDFMVDVAVLLGAEKKTAKIDLKKVYFFERSIHTDTRDNDEDPIENINIQTIEDLYKVSNYHWLEYINNMTWPIARFENRSTISVSDSDFLRRVSRSLKHTEKRTVANFVIWRVVSESVKYLPNEYRDKFNEFSKIISKKQTYPLKTPRWEECVKSIADMDNGLAIAVSSMYVKRFFRDETRKRVELLIATIAEAFRETVNKTSWMSDSMKESALEKLELMRTFIAYPDELLNDKKLDEYSLSLDMVPDDHFQNFLNLQRFHYELELSHLDKATSEYLWTFYSDYFSVNVILAGILQPPIYNPEWPSYAIFGGIGFAIGHEIMHAYDPPFIAYKTPGVMSGWLDETKTETFADRMECLLDQYGAYVDKQTGAKINEFSTLNENAADSAGLKIAHRAYRNWVKKYGEDPRPTQLQNYTSNQLFFVSSMNFFCQKTTREQRYDDVKIDVHSPADIRALGMFSNSEEFTRAFNCPVGSTMNPGKRCVFWE